ncbi:hypothetical protein O5O45_16345 [Hahella aquimaris]|uniref:hypothetical protein n=1 Tax=Hahella sp. HNIBRBA332 TaxID=3015983 RepID=UPI00273C9A2D|nr:hypothetical protein [Hahella sp. HNIBRBA332]WLQ11317.1 hypothetical protein O5O45_16345 [Hahella sp. HNIBRBA332]
MVNDLIISKYNYTESPIVSWDLSDVEVIMRLPDHEAPFESVFIGKADIYSRDSYSRTYPSHSILTLLDCGWECRYSKSQAYAGYMTISMALSYIVDDKAEYDSLINKEELQRWLVNIGYAPYKDLDREVDEEFSQLGRSPTLEDYWVYPKKNSDFMRREHDGGVWFSAPVGHPSTGTYYIVNTAITAKHFLSFRVSFTGFRDNEFPSASEWESNKEKLLEEFLEHVNIKYPPETLEEITRYNNAK